MFLEQFFVPGLGHSSYLIGSERTGAAAVIDPRRDYRVYLEAARDAGLHIRYVLETHVHNDFLSGAHALAQASGATHLAPAGAGLQFDHHPLGDGDRVELGELEVTAWLTPGHTPEHMSFVVTDHGRADVPVLVFSGGDLLVGAVGRPDLLGMELGRELAPKLHDSLFGRLLTLEDYVEVLPTHGAGSLCGKGISGKRTTTIGYERRFNEALQQPDKDGFIRYVLEGNPGIPTYYRRMRPGNQAGATGWNSAVPIALEVADVEHLAQHDAIVIDTRSHPAFAGGHIPGSINIGLGDSLVTWTGWMVPATVPLVLVLGSDQDWERVTTTLGRIGFEQVAGYLRGGIAAWVESGRSTATLESLSVDRLRRELRDLRLVDVRNQSEWDGGHVHGAIHIPLDQLPDRLDEVRGSGPLAVICGSGYRSSLACSLLLRAGVPDVHNVLGGMTAWRAAGHPVEAATPA